MIESVISDVFVLEFTTLLNVESQHKPVLTTALSVDQTRPLIIKTMLDGV